MWRGGLPGTCISEEQAQDEEQVWVGPVASEVTMGHQGDSWLVGLEPGREIGI